MKLANVLVVIAATIVAAHSRAGLGGVPNDIAQLSGAFEGHTVNSKRKVKVFILPQQEKLETYLVAMLIGDPQGLVFTGTRIPDTQIIGLASLGANQSEGEVTVVDPPAALMEIVYNRPQDPEKIVIGPQPGTTILNEKVELDSYDSGVVLSPPIVGDYELRGNTAAVDAKGNLEIEVPALNLHGHFNSTPDISSITVLKGIVYDRNYAHHETNTIAAFAISIVDGRRTYLLLGQPNANGTPANVIVLRRK